MRLVIVLTLLFATTGEVARLRADVFLLTGGGRLEGELANREQNPRTTYVVRTADGTTATLAKEQVESVIDRSPDETEYETVRHRFPDSNEGQYAIAEWCREHKLTQLQKEHLKRVIELDPNHVKARTQLGYNRIGGQWRTTTEHQTAMGKVQYRGQWHYPQEIEILEAKQRVDKARREWFAALDRLRKQLSTERSEGAKTAIVEIADPAAVAALNEALTKEGSEDVRRLYVQALAKIGSADAVAALTDRSLNDPSEEVRLTCLDMLEKQPRHALVTFYIQNLRNPNNEVLNRAAAALRRFPDSRAVPALIDALVTKHKFKVTTGDSGGGLSATNGSLGSGLSMGSSTMILSQDMQNPTVLDTLVRTAAGPNYLYDVAAWKQWYAGRKKNQLLDVRRN